MNSSTIVQIDLCVLRATLRVAFCLGLGVHLQIGKWPRLNVMAGPFILEVGRR